MSSFSFLFFFFIHEQLARLYLSVPHISLMPMELRKKYHNPWNWNYGWLYATMQVLGSKPGSSVRAANALNQCTNSLAPSHPFLRQSCLVAQTSLKLEILLPFRSWDYDTNHHGWLCSHCENVLGCVELWPSKITSSCSTQRKRKAMRVSFLDEFLKAPYGSCQINKSQMGKADRFGN